MTGGFKNRKQVIDVIASGTVEMIGLGRAMILDPSLSNSWLNDIDDKISFPRFTETVPGGITAWYTMKQIALATDDETFDMDLTKALRIYEDIDAKRVNKWKKKFSI